MDANPDPPKPWSEHVQDVPRVAARELVATLRAAGAPLARLRPLPEPPRGTDPHVVLVHGYLGHRDQLRALHRSLVAAGRTGVSRPGYPSTRLPLEAIATRIERHVVPLAAEGPVDLVGHSLGAVACRAWIKAFGGHRYVRRFVSLGGPHGGTLLYRLAPPRLWDVLDPDGPWVGRLADGPEPVPTWHVHPRYDHQVLPPRPVHLDGATEIVLERVGHNGMLWSEEAHRAVIAALS